MDTRKNRQKWVEALRSGDYKQGKSALNRKNTYFCCLGVACDVYMKETGRGRWTKAFRNLSTFNLDEFSSVEYMPTEVKDWLGLEDAGRLIRANDYLDKSFSEIADMVEEMTE